MSLGYEILDPERIARAAGRKVAWRTSLRTWMRFQDMIEELVALGELPSDREVEEAKRALREDIQSLPGFPRYDPDRDIVVPEITTAMR